MLHVQVKKRLGDTRIEIGFEIDARVTALFGPSGSGKTSLINMVAGLVRPDQGRIAFGSEVFFDSRCGIDVRPHRRRIGYVFQEGRLFPHLTVGHNLAFGRWMVGLRRDEEHERRVIDLLGIEHLLKRRPGALSGGEKQRVAIGRSLLSKPKLLLLDEPLAALDEERKQDILPYLERLRGEGVPMIYVSHNPAEVARLADTVVCIAQGTIAEIFDGASFASHHAAKPSPHQRPDASHELSLPEKASRVGSR